MTMLSPLCQNGYVVGVVKKIDHVAILATVIKHSSNKKNANYY
jgi:hypothetical protein